MLLSTKQSEQDELHTEMQLVALHKAHPSAHG